MASQQEVDFGAMSKGAGDVRQANSELQGRLSAIRGRVDSTRGNWEGEAAVAFASLMQHYDDASRRQQEALEEIAQGIETNGKQFNASEDANLQSIKSVGANAGGSINMS